MTKNKKYILAHDAGTGSDKAAIVDTKGQILEHRTAEYEVLYPRRGYAEQNPDDWWDAVVDTSRELLGITGIDPADVIGVVFSAQMAGTLPVDEEGTPLMPSMIWLDTRASKQAKQIWSGLVKISGVNVFTLAEFLWITGGGPGRAGKDTISRVLWLRENEPEIYEETHKFLDSKDYLVYRCTEKFLTSQDNANITWLMDIRNREWSDRICDKYDIDADKLPNIKKSTEIAGDLTSNAAQDLGLGEGVPVIVGAGDITSAAVGSGAVREYKTHAYVGTSSWIANHTFGQEKDVSHYIGSICSANPEMYLCTAEQENAGACLDWIKNHMFGKESEEYRGKEGELYQLLDEVVKEVEPGSKGLIFTPWMYGERAPLDDHSVRGGLHNLSLDHTREHVVRAVFEGVAFNMKWALHYLEKLTERADFINLIGGGASSDIWCQIFADVLGRRINKMHQPREAGVRGAAMIASIGLGHIKKFEDVEKIVKVERIFEPRSENRKLYGEVFEEFKNIYENNKDMYQRLNEGY